MIKHFILKVRRNVAFFYLLYQCVGDNKKVNTGPVCFNYGTWLICKFLPEREFGSIGVRELPFLTQFTKELRVPEIGRRTHIKYIWIIVVVDATSCTVPVTPNNYIGGVHLHYAVIKLYKKIRIYIIGSVNGADCKFFTL